jgi:subtilisin family serine protease/fibronectin type 3 domain-containing protein
MRKSALKVLSALLTFVFTSQTALAFASTNAVLSSQQNSSKNKTAYYIEKNGKREYIDPATGKIISSSTSIASNNTVDKSSSSTTKNIRKSELKKQLEAGKSTAKSTSKASSIKNDSKKLKERPKYVEGELIVKFKTGTTSSAKQSLYTKNSLKVKKTSKVTAADLVTLPKGANVDNAVKALKADKNVELVQPNYLYYPENISSDPMSSQLWGHENVGQEIYGIPGTEDIDIDVPEAWSITKGSANVVIGIIDTGVDIKHPDLMDKIWTNPGETPNNGIDDDNNGYVDDINGWDFYNRDNSVFDHRDGDEHGTHVAGTIAASIDNNEGIAGVAPKVKIMPLKFIGPYGGDTYDAVEAIEYAKAKGVKITNNSWGGDGNDSLLKAAIENSGMLFVVAAGNDGRNIDAYPTYPASFESNNILTVASIDNIGDLAYDSNYGLGSVDVAAPGVGILSTVPKLATKGAAILSDNGTYKTLFHGFGLESIDDTQRQGFMQSSLNSFGLALSDKILLVQDDESTSGASYYYNYKDMYESALRNLGYTNITVKTVPHNGNGPDAATLSQYKLVIWFTGNASGEFSTSYSALTPADQTNLISYLSAGGNLFLSGKEAGWTIEDTTFYRNYLHANFVYEDEGTRKKLNGVMATSYEAKSYNFIPTYFVDYLEPADAFGKVVLVYPGATDYTDAYAYYSGTSMATPHVTGIAALLLSDQNINILQIKEKIKASTNSLPSLYGMIATGGLANAAAALRMGAIDLDGDIPGNELKPVNVDTLTFATDNARDIDDVYYIDLKAGESVTFNLTGDAATDFDLHLFSPQSYTVRNAWGLLKSSENPNSTESIEYIAEYPGRYYVDVYAYSGSGSYTLTYAKNGNIVYDDKNPSLWYYGQWKEVPNSLHENGTIKTLNSPGSVMLNFFGSKVTWTGYTDNTQGIARVFIDGKLVQDVNLYSPTPRYKVELLNKSLAYGPHTLEIQWTGMFNKGNKKTFTTINIDTISISTEIPKPQPPTNLITTGVLDGVMVDFEYTVSDAIDHFNIYRSMDGVNFEVINEVPYHVEDPYYYIWDDIPGDTTQPYTYKVTAVSIYGLESNPSKISTATPLRANSRYTLEDISNHLVYNQGSQWTTETGTNYSGGTVHVTVNPGDKVTIPFTGYGFDLMVLAGPDMGIARVTYPFGEGFSYDYNLNNPVQDTWNLGGLSSGRQIGSVVVLEAISGKISFDFAIIKDIEEIGNPVERPLAPTTLKGAINAARTGVNLAWLDNAEPDVKGYDVYRSTAPGIEGTKINPAPIINPIPSTNEFSYLDTTIQPNTNYYYTIKAIDFAGNVSDKSNEVAIKLAPPAAPTGLTVIKVTDGAELTWNSNNPATEIMGYNVYRSLSSGTGYSAPINAILITGTKFVDTTIEAGKTYYYFVTAINNDGLMSDKSDEVEFKQAVQPPTTIVTRYEDNNSDITFSGTWYKYTDPKSSGGNHSNTFTKGASFEFTFTGTGIRWYGFTSNSRGIAKVFIDGVEIQDVDCYTSTSVYQKLLFEKSDLSYGTHTIKIVATGNKNSSSTGISVTLDALETLKVPQIIKTKYEDNNSGITFSGTWYKYTDPKSSGGNHSNTFTKGASFEFTFTGTGIRWYGFTSNSRGIAKVFIDGVEIQDVDCYTSTSVYQKLLFEKSDLSYGTHTIKIVATGNKNSSSTGISVTLDALEVETY